MTKKKPTFQKKWQACLYEALRISRQRWWEPWSKKAAWDWDVDRKYLREHGVTTYNAFEHHIRRLSSWGFLYQFEEALAHQYLVSRKGISRLERLGVIDAEKASGLKRRASLERED